jgi:glutathione S-transferase
LLTKFDHENKLLPKDPALQSKVREYMWASEGSFFMHALPIWKLRQYCEGSKKATDILPEIEKKFSGPVQDDFNWLEHELAQGGGKYLVGDSLTAADTMMEFTIQFIIAFDLGLEKKRSWPHINRWLKNVENRTAYMQAVAKTGHQL